MDRVSDDSATRDDTIRVLAQCVNNGITTRTRRSMRMSSNHKDLRGWAIQSIRAQKKKKSQQNPIKRMGGLVGETNEWIEYQSAQHKCKCRQ